MAVGLTGQATPRTGCAPAKRRVRAAAETDSLLARATSAHLVQNIDLFSIERVLVLPMT